MKYKIEEIFYTEYDNGEVKLKSIFEISKKVSFIGLFEYWSKMESCAGGMDCSIVCSTLNFQTREEAEAYILTK